MGQDSTMKLEWLRDKITGIVFYRVNGLIYHWVLREGKVKLGKPGFLLSPQSMIIAADRLEPLIDYYGLDEYRLPVVLFLDKNPELVFDPFGMEL